MVLFAPRRKTRRFNAVIKTKNPRRRGFFGTVNLLVSRVPKSIFFVAGALMFAAGALVYVFFISNQFSVTEMSVEGAKGTLAERVEQTASMELNKKQWGLFHRNSTIFFPKDDVRAALTEAFPQLESVSLKVKAPHALSITVTERTSIGIWCVHGGVSPGGVASCYFYDDNGVIYEVGPNAARGFLITTIRDKRVTEARLGERVLDEGTLALVEYITDLLAQAYERPVYIELRPDEEFSVGFRQDWEVFFSRSKDVQEQVESLMLTLENEIGVRAAELEYVDVRLGNKVFYRYDGEAPVPTDNSPTKEEDSQEESE